MNPPLDSDGCESARREWISVFCTDHTKQSDWGQTVLNHYLINK